VNLSREREKTLRTNLVVVLFFICFPGIFLLKSSLLLEPSATIKTSTCVTGEKTIFKSRLSGLFISNFSP